MKALGLPFTVMSCSDPNMQCRGFVKHNYPELAPTHCLEDQCSHRPCSMHPYAVDGCDACPTGRGTADFAIAGSPCHPFSQQRSQRFSHMSVEKHHEYRTTMSSLLQWANHFEPKSWVMEQVRGFDMPFEKQATETPLKRRGGGSGSSRFWSLESTADFQNVTLPTLLPLACPDSPIPFTFHHCFLPFSTPLVQRFWHEFGSFAIAAASQVRCKSRSITLIVTLIMSLFGPNQQPLGPWVLGPRPQGPRP